MLAHTTLLLLALLQPAEPTVPASATLGGPEELDSARRLMAANAAYEAGEWQASIDSYEALLERGYDSGLLQYNLGNALLRNGELGRAISALRRARAQLPRNQEVQQNLEFARRSAKDDLLPPEPALVAKTLFFWHYALGPRELWRVAILSNLLFWALLLIRILVRRRLEAVRLALVVTVAVFVASGGSLAARALLPLRVAVVLPPELNVYSGARSDTEVRFRLHAGSEVRLLERLDDWLRIALPDGEQGWIEARYSETLAQ